MPGSALTAPASKEKGNQTSAEYPPRQEAASFSLDKVLEKLSQPGGSQ
jgi:hypothetical protein